MGATVPPKPYIPADNLCKDCAYFQEKWKSEHSQWSYCDYWHKDTKEGSPCCDKFEKE